MTTRIIGGTTTISAPTTTTYIVVSGTLDVASGGVVSGATAVGPGIAALYDTRRRDLGAVRGHAGRRRRARSQGRSRPASSGRRLGTISRGARGGRDSVDRRRIARPRGPRPPRLPAGADVAGEPPEAVLPDYLRAPDAKPQ